MKTLPRLLLLGWAGLLLGCDQDGPPVKKPESVAKTAPTPRKKGEIGPNVFLETEGSQRRVLVNAYVCLRQGQLEQFLTRKETKEHEAILAADIDARHLHAALIACGATQGKPVRFHPKYESASGSLINISLQYEAQGQVVTVPARKWIRHVKTGKELTYNWVFAGSQFFQDPLDKTKKPFYAANQGDVICLSNFETALLDLPIASPKDNEELFYEAHTDRIPPLQTKVMVILEPLPPGKSK